MKSVQVLNLFVVAIVFGSMSSAYAGSPAGAGAALATTLALENHGGSGSVPPDTSDDTLAVDPTLAHAVNQILCHSSDDIKAAELASGLSFNPLIATNLLALDAMAPSVGEYILTNLVPRDEVLKLAQSKSISGSCSVASQAIEDRAYKNCDLYSSCYTDPAELTTATPATNAAASGAQN